MTEIAVRKGSLELLAELERNGGISEIGLHLANPDLPYTQFQGLCVLLGRMHEAVRFAIGDLIILGEQLYGQEAFQALESLNLSEDARQEYVRVSARVARSRRRPGLSWSHHRAVASLARKTKDGKFIPDAKAQTEWLDRAVKENLSHHQLRDALRNGADPEPGTCRCCHRAFDS